MLKKFNLFLSVLILILFLLVLKKTNGFHQVKILIERASFKDIALALAVYLIVYVFRALRVRLFIPEVSVFKTIEVLCVHTFLNNVLPFRSGETSFPILMKKFFGISYSRTTALLAAARVFDMITLATIFLISAVWASSDATLVLLPIAVLLAIFLTVFFFLKMSSSVVSKFPMLSGFFEHFKGVLFTKVIEMLFFSFLIWGTKFLSFEIIFKAAGLDIGYLETVFVLTFAELTTILPIHSIGGFGTFEAGAVLGFSLVGVNPKKALAIAVYFHSILLLMSAITALFGWIGLSIKSVNETEDKSV